MNFKSLYLGVTLVAVMILSQGSGCAALRLIPEQDLSKIRGFDNCPCRSLNPYQKGTKCTFNPKFTACRTEPAGGPGEMDAGTICAAEGAVMSTVQEETREMNEQCVE